MLPFGLEWVFLSDPHDPESDLDSHNSESSNNNSEDNGAETGQENSRESPLGREDNDVPSSNDSSSSGDDSHNSGENNDNDSNESHSPGIPERNHPDDFCTHTQVSELPCDNEEARLNTTCDFNPEIVNGQFIHHPAYQGYDTAYFCGDCHKIFCRPCIDPEYPTGYSDTSGESSDKGEEPPSKYS